MCRVLRVVIRSRGSSPHGAFKRGNMRGDHATSRRQHRACTAPPPNPNKRGLHWPRASGIMAAQHDCSAKQHFGATCLDTAIAATCRRSSISPWFAVHVPPDRTIIDQPYLLRLIPWTAGGSECIVSLQESCFGFSFTLLTLCFILQPPPMPRRASTIVLKSRLSERSLVRKGSRTAGQNHVVLSRSGSDSYHVMLQ